MAEAAVHIVDGDIARLYARRRWWNGTQVPVHIVGSCSRARGGQGGARGGLAAVGQQGSASWPSWRGISTATDGKRANVRSNSIGER